MAKRKPPVSGKDTVPVGPTLSMFDPVYLGIDEAGEPVYLPMMYNNLLIGGVPGSGKSVALSLIVAPRRPLRRLPAVPHRRQTGRARPVARLPPTCSSAPTSTTPSPPCAGCKP